MTAILYKYINISLKLGFTSDGEQRKEIERRENEKIKRNETHCSVRCLAAHS